METATIEKLIPGGQALATLPSGKYVFVWNALPGETVELQITKNKSSYCEAIATKILQQSKRRRNPRDLCYLSTSPWQILDYAYELEQKTELTKECLRQANPSTEIPVESTITDNQDYFYRNKMEYSLYWNNQTNQINLALHSRGTHRKIPITTSSLERPEILAKAQEIISDLNAKHHEARSYQSLLIRCNQQGTTSAALYENHKPHPKMTPLTDTLLDNQYSYSPNGFFQINLPAYELALKEIKKHIATEKVLDLYAGVGTIGLSVARNHNLTLVETNTAAFKELVKNCTSINPDNTQKGVAGFQPNPILASAEDSLDFITPDTTIILDPPRAGCHPKLIEKLALIRPPTIIYLSCNPITQARDLNLLQTTTKKPYKIIATQPFNFFPRTPHIENLLILSI